MFLTSNCNSECTVKMRESLHGDISKLHAWAENWEYWETYSSHASFHKLFRPHTMQLLHLYFMHTDIYCLIIYRARYTCYKAMWCSHLIYLGRITFCQGICCNDVHSKYLIALETSESIFLWRVLNYVNFPMMRCTSQYYLNLEQLGGGGKVFAYGTLPTKSQCRCLQGNRAESHFHYFQ